MIPSLCNLSIAAPSIAALSIGIPGHSEFDKLSEDELLIFVLNGSQDGTDLEWLKALCNVPNKRINAFCAKNHFMWNRLLKKRGWFCRWVETKSEPESQRLSQRDFFQKMLANDSWLERLKTEEWMPEITSWPDPLRPGGLYAEDYYNMVSKMKPVYQVALLALNAPGITTIPDGAFSYCEDIALKILPNTLTTIGEGAFSGCTSLILESLPGGLTTIGKSAFTECSNLALKTLPEGLTMIGHLAFWNCTSLVNMNLENLTMLGTIETYAFTFCTSLVNINLPNSLSKIAKFAFSHCKNLKLASLPNSLTNIEQEAFSGCYNLALTSLPDSLISIAVDAFNGCKPPISKLVYDWRLKRTTK